jgi:hypothetical protein
MLKSVKILEAMKKIGWRKRREEQDKERQATRRKEKGIRKGNIQTKNKEEKRGKYKKRRKEPNTKMYHQMNLNNYKKHKPK